MLKKKIANFVHSKSILCAYLMNNGGITQYAHHALFARKHVHLKLLATNVC